ncbi:MAG TPA: hypothetical protein VG496_03190 [Myxococcales bacterium]|nr:hypothetical protein [Myxococcales bacterium]
MSFVSAIFRNILGKPSAADFRDSAEHFVRVMREHGIGLTWGRDELLFVDDLVERLKAHNEYRDAIGCYFGELLVRNFSGEWVPGHALGPAVRVATAKGVKHLFPLGWVYRRADGGPAESIARKCERDLGFPEDRDGLGSFTDSGERVWPPRREVRR